MIELGSTDGHQQVPFLYPIADVHEALVDIAAGAGIEVRGRKRQGRSRQGDERDAVAWPYHRHAHARYRTKSLVSGCNRLPVLRNVPHSTKSDPAAEQGQGTDREQPACPS